MVLRSLLSWATHPRHCCSEKITFSHLNRLSNLVSNVVDVLEQVHGDLISSTTNFAAYEESFDGNLAKNLKPELEDCDFFVVCSDEVEVPCQRKTLCRIAYFYSMLHGGFRESLQHDRLRLEMPSAIVKLILESITTGTISDLRPDRLLEVYTMFDYLQSDRLFEVLDNHFRRNVFRWIATSEEELFLNLSSELMHRVFPLIVGDLMKVFGLRGYAFALRSLLRWIEVRRNFKQSDGVTYT